MEVKLSVQVSQTIHCGNNKKGLPQDPSSAVFLKDITQNHFLRDKDPFLKSGHKYCSFVHFFLELFLCMQQDMRLYTAIRSVSHLYIAVARG